MKRIVSIISLFVIISVMFCGCDSLENDTVENHKGMRKVSFKNIDYYVYKDWKEGTESGDEQSSFMYYYPSKGMLMVNVQKTDIDLSEESNWQSVMDGVKTDIDNYIQRSLKKVSVDDYDGFEAVYSGKVSGKETTNEMVAFTTGENQLIVFSMTSFSKNKKLYHKQFEQVLYSVEVNSLEDDEESITVAETDIDDSLEDYLDVEEPTQPDVPTEYLNALEKADSYANYQYMSKKSLYKQLTSDYGEGFSKKAAKYAIKHVKTNWKKNALHKAEDYANDQYMSKQGVYEQLKSAYGEQFTEKQAKYAIKHVKANWKKNALQKARDYSESMHMSRQEIYNQLVSQYGEKFTAQEAQYAINHLK